MKPNGDSWHVLTSFTLVPIAIDGDASMAGWAPDGRILVRGHRYPFSLWRYRRLAHFR